MNKIFLKSLYTLTVFVGTLFAFSTCSKNEPDNPSGGKESGGDSKVAVTGVSLSSSVLSLEEGETATLTATITPSNAANKRIVWASADNKVATVADGVVTGVKAGTTAVSATAEDGGKTAACLVTVIATVAPSVTTVADHITAVSAVLHGKANIGSTASSDLKVGFQYSKSAGILPSNSMTVEATDADADYNYSTGIVGLEPDTKYYFRSFVRQNGQDTYGETKEFTTKDVASLLETKDASAIEAAKANLNAKLDLTDVQYKSLAYGFYWGASEAVQNTDFKCTEIKDNAISASLTGLSHKTQYWYKAYVKLDDKTFIGEVKTFTTDVVPVESVSLDKTEYTFNTIGNTLTLTATVSPADATDKSVEWSTSNADVVTVDQNGKVTAIGNGTATVTVTTKDQGKTATCAITVPSVQAVDLGLSVKWSSWNLGATKPEEYGDYYAWGETEPKDNYNWSTYKWCNGNYNSLAKYNTSSDYGTVDNRVVLDPEDDAAHAVLGGTWRMPTDAEWTELRTNCTWRWTTENGVYGRKVTGPNGNSIFLPAAGFRFDSDLYDMGSLGYYWSSSLFMDRPYCVWDVDFNSGGVYRSNYYFYRCNGFSVRPVSD